MIKMIGLVGLLLFSSVCIGENPPGFLWYNLPKPPVKKEDNVKEIPKARGIPFNQLSYTDKDKVLHFYTMEALHKAHHTQKMEDMKVFLSLQDYWLKESSRFSQLFQKTMLYNPQYDYTVTHPTSSIGTKILDETREQKRTSVIKSLAKNHGLLFFYRGNSPYDLKQIPIVRDFCNLFGLSLIAFRVDKGVPFEGLPDSRQDKGQAASLGVRYFPALLLVNPKTKKTVPVAYGLTTQDVLTMRLFAVATHFKGEV